MAYYNSAALYGGFDTTKGISDTELPIAVALAKKGRPSLPDELAAVIVTVAREYDNARVTGNYDIAARIRDSLVKKIARETPLSERSALNLFNSIKRSLHNNGKRTLSKAARAARRQNALDYLRNPNEPWLGSSLRDPRIYTYWRASTGKKVGSRVFGRVKPEPPASGLAGVRRGRPEDLQAEEDELKALL